MEKFNLERRAEELFPIGGSHAAIKLAGELAEAIAAEIERVEASGGIPAYAWIARSFVRPRTHEDVYREALEYYAKWTNDGDRARAALAWRQL